MNATAPYEKLKMPVALYDSTRPAAMSEKMAPVTAPLTVRLRNFSTSLHFRKSGTPTRSRDGPAVARTAGPSPRP